MTIWIESPFDSLPIEGYRKQRYWLMAEAFVRAGHSVIYWTSDFSHATKAKRQVKVCGEEEPCNFDIVFVPTRQYAKNVCWHRFVSHRAYARTWERMAVESVAAGGSRPDVIIVSLPPVSAGAIGLRLARRFAAKFVVDVQDAWPETFYRLLPKCFRWLGRFLFAGMRKSVGDAYRAADLVTGVCDRYEALVKDYGARDYYRAYLGIECSGESGRGSLRRAMCDGIRLVYVGNMGVSYDLKTVVEGIRLMKKRGWIVTCDIAGFGGQIEGADGVRFHGMLSRKALQELLSRCDIGIIPMQEDSFVGVPNKLAEYVSAGLKVISSLQGETAALLARYRCGETYLAKDVESFVRAVERAQSLSDDDGCRRLLEDELSADRIYDAYCKRICAL